MRGDPKSEPFRRAGCLRDNCLVCSSGEKGKSDKNSSRYRIICKKCQEDKINAIYKGETGKNPYSRGLEHQDGLTLKYEDNPLWKHSTLKQEGEQVEFKLKALRSFKSCLMRQVNEPVSLSFAYYDFYSGVETCQ